MLSQAELYLALDDITKKCLSGPVKPGVMPMYAKMAGLEIDLGGPESETNLIAEPIVKFVEIRRADRRDGFLEVAYAMQAWDAYRAYLRTKEFRISSTPAAAAQLA
jgi:hypothetical protein